MQVCTCCGVACGKCLANEGLLKEATALRNALRSLRPYFGKLVDDDKEKGASYWQAARDAFAVLEES